MKILIVTPKLPPDYSGVAQRVSRHAEFLNSRGFLTQIVTNTRNAKQSENIYLKNIDISKIHSFYLLNRSTSFEYKIMRKLYTLINMIILFFQSGLYVYNNKNRFEIAHCFSSEITPLFVALFSIFFSKKVVIESTLMGSDSGPKGKMGFVKDYIYRKADAIICISDALKEEFLKFGYRKEKIVVIPNDVDKTLFFPVDLKERYIIRKELGLPLDSKILLFVGGLTYRKGFDIAIKIFVNISDLINDIHFVVVGRTESKIAIDQKIKEEFLNMIKDNSLQNRVHIIGPNQKIDKFMKASDVFLFPSRREGFGTVQIESMAAGCPVIAANLPGITENIIENGIDGFIIYDVENIDNYVEVVNKVLLNSNLSMYVINNALEKIHSNFSRETIMKKYMDIYNIV